MRHYTPAWATERDSISKKEKKEQERTHGDTSKEEDHMTMEIEMGVMQLQAVECQGLLAMARSQERGTEEILPQSLQKLPTLPKP